MARVWLRRVWVGVVGDPSDQVCLPCDVVVDSELSVAADYQVTAAGRSRRIGFPGRVVTASLGMEFVPRDLVRWLERHVGRVVCVRGDDGFKMFGSYDGVVSARIKTEGLFYQVQVEVRSVSVREFV